MRKAIISIIWFLFLILLKLNGSAQESTCNNKVRYKSENSGRPSNLGLGVGYYAVMGHSIPKTTPAKIKKDIIVEIEPATKKNKDHYKLKKIRSRNSFLKRENRSLS
jgi:hypothetical protein